MTANDTSPEPGPAKSKANSFRILLVVVLIIGALYSGFWLYGAQTIRSQVDAALASSSTGSTLISCGEIGVGGWPFRFDVTCNNASYVVDDVSVNLPQIKGTALVYRPTHIQLFAQSPARISDAFTGIERQIEWEDLRASARSAGWSLRRVSVEGNGFTVSDTLIADTELARIGHIEAHVLDSPEQFDAATGLTELAIYARVDDADLSELAITGATLRLEAEVPGMPADMRAWTLPELAGNWQKTPIRLLALNAEDQQSSIAIVGVIGTTQDVRLEGNFDLTTNNVYEPLSAFVEENMLEMFLGQVSDDGSRYRSYALRHGVLLAGNLPILSIPPLL